MRYILRKFTFGFTVGMLALSACAAKASPPEPTGDPRIGCAMSVMQANHTMSFGDAIEFCNG